MLASDAPLKQIIEITETPRDKAKSSNTEKRIEDLRVDLDPYTARRVEIITVFDAMQVFRVAHELAAASDEQKEKHATPCNNIKAIDNNEKTEWCDEKFPEGF